MNEIVLLLNEASKKVKCINNYEKPIGHAFSGALKLPGSPVYCGGFLFMEMSAL